MSDFKRNVKQFPIIELNSIRIVNFDRCHLTERYVSWLNDPEVVRYSEQRHKNHSIKSCEQYFLSTQESPNFFLAIEAKDPNLGHIGNIGVAIDQHNLTSDMSIIIGEKRAWNKGLASLAWKTVQEELLTNQGIRKITAGTLAVNQPMLKLMKRAGMHIEAIRRRQFLLNGQETDVIYAAIFSNGLSYQ